jgi:two-component system phosphate regulon response regulator PhoB
MDAPGAVFSRAELQEFMSGAKVDARTVDVYIGRLRRALSKAGERDPIRTVRSIGYAFDETFGEIE